MTPQIHFLMLWRRTPLSFQEPCWQCAQGLSLCMACRFPLGVSARGFVCVVSAAEPWEPAVAISLAGPNVQPRLAVKLSATGAWIQICTS